MAQEWSAAEVKQYILGNRLSFEEIKTVAMLEACNDGIILFRKFGQTATLTADTEADVWRAGGTRTIFTSASTLSISSSSANDVVGGTGAWYLFLVGLDADYNLLTENVSLNGTTPVTTSGSFLTVNRARVVYSGSGRANAGTITATHGGNTQFSFNAGFSISQHAHYTVPAGYTLFTTGLTLSAQRSSGSGTRHAEVDQFVYVPSTNTKYRTLQYGVSNEHAIVTATPTPSSTPEKCTLWLTAVADSNNTTVSAVQEFLLIKGDWNNYTLN
jgi:hypothetical protein